MKAQIHVHKNNKKEALENVQKCLELHRGFDKGWLLYALLKEQSGNLDGAIKGYTSFLEVTNTTNHKVAQHLLNLVMKQKMIQQGDTSLIIGQGCFKKALLLFEQKEYKQALKQINECLQKKPDDTEIRLLKIQILSALKDITQAVNLLATWIRNEPTNTVWFDTLHLLAAQQYTHNPIISTLQKLTQEQPKNLWPKLYLADLYLRNNDDDNALTHLKKALPITNDPMLKTKVLFQMGVIYYEKQQFDLMKKALLQGKNLTPNFSPLLNLLAYYYAKKEKNSTEAQTLINNALATDKNNPHFLDTQAYIFYKNKQYDKARILLEKLTKQASNSCTVLKHLSKTYYKLGKTEKALDTLDKTLNTLKSSQEKNKLALLRKQWKQAHRE